MEIGLLREEEKEYTREKLEEILPEVPEGERLQIEKELLEQLLFEKIDLGSYGACKLPIWSGEFLSKIDLSGISYEDVSWTFLAGGYNKLGSDFDENIREKLREIRQDVKNKSKFSVNYIGTNANIDFSLSLESKLEKSGKLKEGLPTILNCNFNGTDLNTSKICGGQYVENCVLDNTNIEFTYRSTFEECSFCGCDFNGKKIDLAKYLSGIYYSKCNFKNTKIGFCLDEYKKMSNSKKWTVLNMLTEIVFKGYVDGSSVDGQEIPDEEYYKEKFCYEVLGLQKDGKELIDSVIRNISQQILAYNKPTE